jgi:hypothetical protein
MCEANAADKGKVKCASRQRIKFSTTDNRKNVEEKKKKKKKVQTMAPDLAFPGDRAKMEHVIKI